MATRKCKITHAACIVSLLAGAILGTALGLVTSLVTKREKSV